MQTINNYRLWSGKTNAVLNLTKQQDDDDCSIIDKIYFCVKDPSEAKYQCLIKNLKKNGLKNRKDLKTLIKYSINMHNVCKNVEEYNPSRKCNVLIVLK